MEGRMKTPREIVPINRLAKVANNAVFQGAGPINIVGIGSNEDRRNGISDFDEMPVQLDSGHRGHMDISD